ncbi:cation:proton antiporter [Lentzea sp. NPDC003310]|uniref:cation:proton antiporter n=1 Tax=Lentzea sp. NPDC003310 TaxID=3154447 RepID=UPI0033A1248B
MTTTGAFSATMRRLLLLLVAVGAGWVLARTTGQDEVTSSGWYFTAATALLAIGLYGSTFGIDLADVRRHLRIVVTAVTVGVLVKAALVTTVMWLSFSTPAYLVLGIAVAQIDPLSTAAAMRSSRLSQRAKSVLAAWAAFDDPITMLLTIYLSALALRAQGVTTGGALAQGGLFSFGTNVIANLALAAAGIGVWWLLSLVRHDRVRLVVRLVLVVAVLAVGVWQFLLFGVAVFGLVARPPIAAVLDRVTRVAFLTASVLLGFLLVGGVLVPQGIVLGLAAFGAQVLVGLVITGGLARRDRTSIAFAQQNGITAIVLVLLLEPEFPGTAAVVAPAILVVNTLHGVFTGFCENYGDRVVALLTGPPRPTRARPPGLGRSGG